MSDTYDTKNTGNQKDTNDFFQPNGIDTIHIRLEELRDGLSYKDFGQKVSISESGVRKYFPPYLSMPSIDKAVSIADAYNVNLDWLAKGIGPKFKDGSIFVLRLGDDLYAKRLQKSYDGSITIISDNKTDYQPLVVPADQLYNLAVIGKVVWVGHDIH